MKNIILSTIAFAFLLTACNQKNKQTEISNLEQNETSSKQYACSMHPEVIGKQGEECSKCGMELTEPVTQTPKTTTIEPKTEMAPKKVVSSSFNSSEIINDYLKLKNALVNDDSKTAATAAKILFVTLNAVNSSSLDSKVKNKYAKIAGDAKEHVKHISDNPEKIEHQREYFALLSKEIHDLIKTFGTDQKLYQAYCPMYAEGESGYWISETKEIKNPYFGSEMLNCGRIVETVK